MHAYLRSLLVSIACATTPCHADCIDDAAARYSTNPDVLRAIAFVESRARPDAVRVNTNGSVDRGMFQINSIHLPTLNRYGLDERHLHDACWSSYIAAWLLRAQMNRFGNTWEAIGAYHSPGSAERRQRYISLVQPVFARYSGRTVR